MLNNTAQTPLMQNEIDPFNPPQYNVSAENDIRQSYAADANPLN